MKNPFGDLISSILDRGKPLADRVATALTSADTPSATVDSLLSEVISTLETTQQEARLAETAALDPLLPAVDADAAQLAAAAPAFRVKRLEAARQRLEVFKAQRTSEEIEAAKVARYKSADKLAEKAARRLSLEYPDLASRLVALLQETIDAAHAVDLVNQDLPMDTAHLHRPEGRARGFPDNYLTDAAFGPYRLVQSVFPTFAESGAVAWPPELSIERLRMYGVGDAPWIINSFHS